MAGGQGSIRRSSCHQPPPLLHQLWGPLLESALLLTGLCGQGGVSLKGVLVHGYPCGTRLPHLLPELKDFLSGLPRASFGILTARAGPPSSHLAVHLQMDTSVC